MQVQPGESPRIPDSTELQQTSQSRCLDVPSLPVEGVGETPSTSTTTGAIAPDIVEGAWSVRTTISMIAVTRAAIG
jgi:hypothetical protein